MKLFSVRTIVLVFAAFASFFTYLYFFPSRKISSDGDKTLAKIDTPHVDAFMATATPVSGKPAKASGYCVPCGGPKSDGDLNENVFSHGPSDTPGYELTGRLATYAVSPSGSSECPVGHGWAARGKFILLLGAAPTRLSGEMVTDGVKTRFILDKNPSQLSANVDGRVPVSVAIWEQAATEALAKTAEEVDQLRGALPPSVKVNDVLSGFRALFCAPTKALFSPVASQNMPGSYNDLTIRVTNDGRVVSWERLNTALPEIERHFRIIAWVD